MYTPNPGSEILHMDTVCRWAWQYLLLDCSQIKMNAVCVIRYLLSPVCRCCPEPKVFSKFEDLEQHMRKQHEVFSCKLCTNHLKVHFMLFLRLFQGFWGQYLSIHFFSLYLHTFPSLTRCSVTSGNGITARDWHSTERTETLMTPATEDTLSANFVMTGILTMMSCLNTCAGTTISATSVMQMALRNTTGKQNEPTLTVWFTSLSYLSLCICS